jgi:Na+-driven multidrug efflux pump
MIISVAMAWLVQLPLAFFLPQIDAIGVNGVRWGVVGGFIVGAASSLIYFRSGKWKRRRV